MKYFIFWLTVTLWTGSSSYLIYYHAGLENVMFLFMTVILPAFILFIVREELDSIGK